MKNVKIQKSTKEKPKLSDGIIWTLMYVISIIHGLMCIVQGILSSCVEQIKLEFNLNDEEFSFFGSINGFGSLIGSIIFTLIIENINHKFLICNMLILNSISHLSFFFKLQYPFLLLSRFVSGFASVFCFIYFPMWVNKFGITDSINFMQTVVQISHTIGKIFGYFIYLILGSKNWKYGFLYETFSVCTMTLIMIIIPYKYYDKDYENQDNNEKSFDIPDHEETIINDIILNIPYIFITLYRSNILFIFVAVDFWYSDYLQYSLNEKDPSHIFWSYFITIVISSLIGLILGNVIINKIGGINSHHIFISMIILQILSVLFGIFSNIVNSIIYFTTLMSAYMIFNSAAGLISISASFLVMPKSLVGTATGFYSIAVNLLAFLPAPYIYAFIKSRISEGKNIIVIFMIYALLGVFELLIAEIYMRVKKIKIYKEAYKKIEIN